MTLRIHAAFALAASIVVAFAVAWGFFLVGSPATRRLERFDERRLQDLQTIAREIQSMVENENKKGTLKGPLPKTLEEAAQRARDQRLNSRDPETNEPYRFRIKNETTYELCATFRAATQLGLGRLLEPPRRLALFHDQRSGSATVSVNRLATICSRFGGVTLPIHPSHNLPEDTRVHERLEAALREHKRRIPGV